MSLGSTVMKANAVKLRKLAGGKVLAGFAGSTADAFTLFDMFETLLQGAKGDLEKAVIEFAKSWRKDKYLRRLEAMMIVLDRKDVFLLSGTGDVIRPEDEMIAAIGSGGAFALSAARALVKHAGDLDEAVLVKDALEIAGDICIYTNKNITIYELEDNEN